MNKEEYLAPIDFVFSPLLLPEQGLNFIFPENSSEQRSGSEDKFAVHKLVGGTAIVAMLVWVNDLTLILVNVVRRDKAAWTMTTKPWLYGSNQ